MIVRVIIAIMVAMAIVGSVSVSNSSTFDISKMDCNKVVYSADWGLDKTLAVMKYCTGGEKEVD
jgi:hypothetical protein